MREYAEQQLACGRHLGRFRAEHAPVRRRQACEELRGRAGERDVREQRVHQRPEPHAARPFAAAGNRGDFNANAFHPTAPGWPQPP